ncbi:MAG: hypothetical protein CR997_04335 [Acidobacteria bacterium]|nr:MAG: hypothetical protein CR997_04335 [Acidobacteriota bacterium]
MNQYDVIIVGAGPAGSCAAFELAKCGIKTLLLDKKQMVGSPNHCGEGISSNCMQELNLSIDMPWIVNEVSGGRLIFSNDTSVTFKQRGFCINRPEFDRHLLKRATDASAEIRTEMKVTEIERETDGWTVKTKTERFRSSYLVGAGGPRCPVAVSLGQRHPLLPAYQYKFKMKAKQHPHVHSNWLDFYHSEAFPGGYAWVFPRGDEVAIGGGSIHHLKQKLDPFCRQMGFDPKDAIKKEGGPIPFLKKPCRIVFPRALLVGDAGGFTYPLTKGGVHGAVWSGKIAGQLISKAIHQSDDRLIRGFKRLVRQHPSRKRSHLMMPLTFFNFKNEAFHCIGNIMDGLEFHNFPIVRFFAEVSRAPSLSALRGIMYAAIIQQHYKKTKHFSW